MERQVESFHRLRWTFTVQFCPVSRDSEEKEAVEAWRGFYEKDVRKDRFWVGWETESFYFEAKFGMGWRKIAEARETVDGSIQGTGKQVDQIA